MNDGKQSACSRRESNPFKTFEGHDDVITSIATFPDGKRIATGSDDETIRIWRLEDGREMKRWNVKKVIRALVISRDGEKVVSAEGDEPGDDADGTMLWVRDAETGIVFAGLLDGHTSFVSALDISRDGGVLASGSHDLRVMLWDTATWKRKGDPLLCGAAVNWVQFSPSGQLGVATDKGIQLWDLDRRERIARFGASTLSLAWTSDEAHIFSVGGGDPVIRSWDTSTRSQAGDPWTGHNDGYINRITLNPKGTLLASASGDGTVRLWQLPTGIEVAQYEHSGDIFSVAFSVDGCYIFSGGLDTKISQWKISEDVLASVAEEPKTKSEAGPSWDKHKNPKGHLDMEIPGQRRNMAIGRLDKSRPRAADAALQSAADAEHPSFTRLHDVKNFFNRMRPSSDKNKKRRAKRKAPEVVDVPLAPATYRDYVASEEDGIRPYSLFFCLGWFQKKEKKPDPPPQVYDVDLMKAEQEDPLDIPIPTTRVRFAQQEDIELTPMSSQSQPEAGPSRLMEDVEHARGLSS